MADYAYLPGLLSYYPIPSEREGMLACADALSDFIVLTRVGLGHTGRICIDDLLQPYKNLRPSLHRLAHLPASSGIDVDAIIYCSNRLPTNLTQMKTVFCARDVAPQVRSTLVNVTAKMRRRDAFILSQSDVLMVCRDNFTDILDLVTLLCGFQIEVNKIVKLFKDNARLMNGLTNTPVTSLNDRIARKSKLAFILGLPQDKIDELARHWDNHLVERFDEMWNLWGGDGNNCSYNVEIHPAITNSIMDCRYVSWTKMVKKVLDDHGLGDRPLHIISSNLFSVVDLLSSFSRDPKYRKELDAIYTTGCLSEVYEQARSLDPKHNVTDNMRYLATREWVKQDLNRQHHTEYLEETCGVYTLPNTCDTGIGMQIIDLGKLDFARADPRLGMGVQGPLLSKSYMSTLNKDNAPVILNFDYAFGDQAGNVLSQLLEHFKKQVASVSIMGKAGTLAGQRGTIMVPTYFIADTSMDVLEFWDGNSLCARDLSQFTPACVESVAGPCLTVVGTVLQTNTVLNYWKNVWKVIGLEMEGYSYMKCLCQYSLLGYLSRDAQINFAYYASDNPLQGETLAQDFGYTGTSSLYAISIGILKNILGSDSLPQDNQPMTVEDIPEAPDLKETHLLGLSMRATRRSSLGNVLRFATNGEEDDDDTV